MAPSSKRSRIVKSISNVREKEDILMKKPDFLKKKEANTARTNTSSNKRVAAQALKRKNKQQHNFTDFEHNDMEDIDQIFLSAMVTAVKAMKAAHKDMDIDQVHELMKDIAEQNEIAKKIAEAISNPIGFKKDIDKADLEAELAALKEEIINEKLFSTSTDILGARLPKALKDNIHVCQNKKKEDDDIAELELWATS